MIASIRLSGRQLLARSRSQGNRSAPGSTSRVIPDWIAKTASCDTVAVGPGKWSNDATVSRKTCSLRWRTPATTSVRRTAGCASLGLHLRHFRGTRQFAECHHRRPRRLPVLRCSNCHTVCNRSTGHPDTTVRLAWAEFRPGNETRSTLVLVPSSPTASTIRACR